MSGVVPRSLASSLLLPAAYEMKARRHDEAIANRFPGGLEGGARMRYCPPCRPQMAPAVFYSTPDELVHQHSPEIESSQAWASGPLTRPCHKHICRTPGLRQVFCSLKPLYPQRGCVGARSRNTDRLVCCKHSRKPSALPNHPKCAISRDNAGLA
jgi:hypothetical protein